MLCGSRLTELSKTIVPRNASFESPARPPPFSGHVGVHLESDTVRGPLPFFNPTQARFQLDEHAQLHPKLLEDKIPHPYATQVALPGVVINWRSRDNRKGRHPLGVDSFHPDSTASFRVVSRGLLRMCTECPYWDVSYLVGVFFSVGCLLFVISGLFYWLPLVAPASEFSTETTAGDILSFVGATLFQIGAVLLVFEACNENRTGCFGWALYQALKGDDSGSLGDIFAKADVYSCQHHHQRRRRPDSVRQQLPAPQQSPPPERQWTWCPTWHELKTHYFHEIGFMASISMFVGATIFYVCGICTLPWIYNNLSMGVLEGVYYLTYLVGGVFFIISSALYILETQPTWYTPAPHLLGWHIGLWNLIGSIGWTLAASFGYCTRSWCAYQSYLTLTWASAAFLIGSMLLWYEALQKYPVEKVR
ncbi:uncharacterized protein N7477_007066 [Penicillium maclennaniae]|uniref:uncharacterized protein n=1 Tax=Penicillium maclennaniae TaxID=1343394 RepID=UPI002540BF5C|nr:uncharacterized protein N7477_007066 [Penicillium maclennaniae]KAJ5668496.1 hypothetical protein N7477_007066 [Penicillium maclennaniae]